MEAHFSALPPGPRLTLLSLWKPCAQLLQPRSSPASRPAPPGGALLSSLRLLVLCRGLHLPGPPPRSSKPQDPVTSLGCCPCPCTHCSHPRLSGSSKSRGLGLAPGGIPALPHPLARRQPGGQQVLTALRPRVVPLAIRRPLHSLLPLLASLLDSGRWAASSPSRHCPQPTVHSVARAITRIAWLPSWT